MSYIVFENPGTFDLRLIKTFGVNVKPNVKSPIGYFGTGLKYAAAIVLRNGGEFYIQDGEMREYTLSTKKTAIRGKEFPIIQICHDYKADELPFTTELGKNWMPWHAYRELYSNALDEGGKRYESKDIPWAKKDVVRFIIKSEPLLEVYYNHGDYFLDTSKLIKIGETAEVEVYDRPTKAFYFKGIQVHHSELQYRYTYNAKSGITLSEDRSHSYEFQRDSIIQEFWRECPNKQAVETFATLPEMFYKDAKIDFSSIHLAENVLNVIDGVMKQRFDKVLPSLRKNVQARRSEESKFNQIEITPIQAKMIERATAILKQFGYEIDNYPVVPVNLGQTLMGMAQDGKIFISKVAFDKGMKQVVATLLEEYIHLEYLVRDCTREMQDVLFDKIVNMMEEKLGEPI